MKKHILHLLAMFIGLSAFGQTLQPSYIRNQKVIIESQTGDKIVNLQVKGIIDSVSKRVSLTELRSMTGRNITEGKQFYVSDRGMEGDWYYDPSDLSSIDNTGTVVVTSDGKRIKRVIKDGINVKWFGAKGDGNADDTSPIQKAFSASIGKKLYIPKGTYKVTSTLEIPGSMTINGDFNQTFITTNSLYRLCIIKSGISDVKIDGIGFISNLVADYSATTETVDPANSFLLGMDFVTYPATLSENINISNCYFSSPSGSVNGIKMIAHRVGLGGSIRDVKIEKCRFVQVGRMAIEVLGESDNAIGYYSGFKIHGCIFNDLGRASLYGMAVSFSGNGYDNLVENAHISGAKNIGLENAGARATTFSNNEIEKLKSGTLMYSLNGSTDLSIVSDNNVVQNNKMLDQTASGISVARQTKLTSIGNTANTTSISVFYGLINCLFQGDAINESSNTTTQTVLTLRDACVGNNFISCNFTGGGNPSFYALVHLSDAGSIDNFFQQCSYTLLPGSGSGIYFADSQNKNINVYRSANRTTSYSTALVPYVANGVNIGSASTPWASIFTNRFTGGSSSDVELSTNGTGNGINFKLGFNGTTYARLAPSTGNFLIKTTTDNGKAFQVEGEATVSVAPTTANGVVRKTELDALSTRVNNLPRFANYTASGGTTVAQFAHSVANITSNSVVMVGSRGVDSKAIAYWTYDATYVYVHYDVATPAGTQNLLYSVWIQP